MCISVMCFFWSYGIILIVFWGMNNFAEYLQLFIFLCLFLFFSNRELLFYLRYIL